MAPFELRDVISLVTAAVTITGAYFAVRSQVGKLETGQVEVLRQLGALHKRMDRYSEELTRIDKNHVRLEERVAALRESQRFRLARREAEEAGQPPMFEESGE